MAVTDERFLPAWMKKELGFSMAYVQKANHNTDGQNDGNTNQYQQNSVFSFFIFRTITK